VARRIPTNQYRCPHCGHNHIRGSQRGRECAQQGQSTNRRARTTPARQHQYPTPAQSTTAGFASIDATRPAKPKPPRPKKPGLGRESARAAARRCLAGQPSPAYTDVLSYVFDRDGFYARLADRLLDTMPVHRRMMRGHWLCNCLSNLSQRLSVGTYTERLQAPIRDILRKARAPRFIANAFGAAAAFSVEKALAAAPTEQLAKALKTVIPLICPDLDVCPAKMTVIKTFASPILAEELKAFASHHRLS
jgi:hypothetical protein